MQRFPLPESVTYSYAPGFTEQHQGVDIMAPLGSPVVAVESGKAWSSIEPKGGQVAYLEGESGTRYFYGHLSAWVLPLITATTGKPLQVGAGAALGFVGTSGNAAGRPPHVHFQIRRPSFFGAEALPASDVVDPYPELVAADPKRRGAGAAPTSSSAGPSLAVMFFLWLTFKDRF